jgi:hypothetical protein
MEPRALKFEWRRVGNNAGVFLVQGDLLESMRVVEEEESVTSCCFAKTLWKKKRGRAESLKLRASWRAMSGGL